MPIDARPTRTLLVDNYDSFTYNLVQLLAVAGADPKVVRNDVHTVDELLAMRPDGILLSPGPGRPEEAGVCVPLLARRPEIPLFGVCLGHQALGASFGATVDRAPVLMHGKTSPVRHDGKGVFEGVPNPFEATRPLCIGQADGQSDIIKRQVVGEVRYSF